MTCFTEASTKTKPNTNAATEQEAKGELSTMQAVGHPIL